MRPHDLLWLDSLPQPVSGVLPEWFDLSWPVVVRRDASGFSHQVPIGVRGLQRQQRCAGWILSSQVCRVCTPEQLAEPCYWESYAACRLPAIGALWQVAPVLNELEVAWGPVGSVGFTLASGVLACRVSSDLDLLIRAPMPLPKAVLNELAVLLKHAACGLDIQVDTSKGGFSLTEWLLGRGQVLLKTAYGPRLVRNPWGDLVA
ncbi:MAG: malonate decarboxylase holo-ACP synthase [Lautropia sp.]|nr:malonate decarboxylase holo-ACP synthase [Lautropia sp.]